MPLPSDIRFQRLLKMQFPRGSPALVVQNTFIHVDDCDAAASRKGCRSNTLPAAMPKSAQRAAFLKELGKLQDTDIISSTAGSELGFSQICDTDDTTPAASCVSSAEQAHQPPPIHLSLSSQDPVLDLPSLKFRQDGDGQNLTDGVDDDCSPLQRWSYIGKSSLAGQQASSDESSTLGTPGDDSSPSLANLRRQTVASPTREEMTTSRHGDDASKTSVGEASLTSIGSKSSPTKPPLVNQAAELLYRMVNKAPRPQPLSWTQCRDACCFSICWTLDARKVRGNDKQVVSPLLELPLAPGGRQVKLRLISIQGKMKCKECKTSGAQEAEASSRSNVNQMRHARHCQCDLHLQLALGVEHRARKGQWTMILPRTTCVVCQNTRMTGTSSLLRIRAT